MPPPPSCPHPRFKARRQNSLRQEHPSRNAQRQARLHGNRALLPAAATLTPHTGTQPIALDDLVSAEAASGSELGVQLLVRALLQLLILMLLLLLLLLFPLTPLRSSCRRLGARFLTMPLPSL